jgi:hypothetical protein
MHRLLVIAALTVLALTSTLSTSIVRADDCDGGSPSTLVEYRRTGGFAGFRDDLVIDTAGHAVITRRFGGSAEFDLDQGTLDELVAALDAAGFPENAGEYLSPGVVSDGFTYVVTYRGATIRTETTAEPDFLKPALKLLDSIVAGAGR